MIKMVIVTATLVGLISTNCFALEFGIGIGANDYDRTIYVPINITNNFRTELSLGYSSNDRKSATDSEANFYDGYSIETGIGLFFLKDVYEKTQIYYGCRLLYINGESKWNYSSGYNYNDKSSGYGIVPTFGVEYLITDHFSLGGEIEFFYTNLNGKTEESYPDTDTVSYDTNSTSSGTNGRVVLRYYF